MNKTLMKWLAVAMLALCALPSWAVGMRSRTFRQRHRVCALDSPLAQSYSPTSLGSRAAAAEIRGVPAEQETSTVVTIQEQETQ